MVGLMFALGLLLATGTALLLAAVTAVAVFGAGTDPFADESLDPSTPLGLLGTNLAIAMIIPAVLLTVFLVHRQRPGFVSSVVGRLRWSFLGLLLLVALTVSISSYLVTLVLPGGFDDHGSSEPPGAATLIALLAVILLTTPLQAAGEEYGFRGYLTQAISSWFDRPGSGAAFAAVVTATSFALAHGGQNPWLFGDRMAFGLVASWLAWRTGGLEAPIALHVSNNLVALVAATLTGQLKEALTGTAIDPLLAVVDVVTMVVFATAADRLSRRRQVAVVCDASAVGYPGKRLGQSVAADG